MEVKGYSLAILGDEGIGKTSFSLKFTQNIFHPKEAPTRGAEYFQKIFDYHNQSIKLDIYGTSGSEKYKKMAKYLYKDARSIILMYKIGSRNTFHNLKKYLEEIRQYSVENPIIYIVGNFSDIPKGSREVSSEELETFAKEEGLKYFEVSCQSGKGIKEVIEELTNEIIVSGKWYTSKIIKDVEESTNLESTENENNRIKKNLKTYNKDKKPNYLRCQACDKLFVVRFKSIFNEVSFICNNCEFESNVPIENLDNYIEGLSSRIFCLECKGKKDSKYKLNYCDKCKGYVCSDCEKKHEKNIKTIGETPHYLCPYYIMDIACFKDTKRNIGYCKSCRKSFCSKCLKQHRKHEVMYFDDFIIQLTKEGKDNIQREILLLNEFKKNWEDCLNTLKKTINKFLIIKEKEIKLKEQLLFQLSHVQYNYQLIETVKNLKYMENLKYDKVASWDKKLTDIFEVIGKPIQIKGINICKDKKNFSITPEKVTIRYNDENTEESERKEITGICSMNNDQYMGVSYNNGSLELYGDLYNNKHPLSVFQIFENHKSINSIQKSERNVNNYFACGQYKIKNIEFYDNYKSYKTINEIIDEEKIFMLCLEQDDYYLTCDVYNKIEIYSKENKKLEDISDCIDPSCSKHILSFNEISNDTIYINYNKLSENKEGIIRGLGGAGPMNMDNIDDFTIDLSMSNTPLVNNQIELGTKIIELNYNRIKREYLLPYKQEIIGVLNDRCILIMDEVYSSIILFDVNCFKNTHRFYWNFGGKPIYAGILNKRVNLIDFIIVDDKMNIFQNIYDEKTKSLKPISGLKNKNDSLKLDPEVMQRGKIIQNPFKSVINYIGSNDFIVVNY